MSQKPRPALLPPDLDPAQPLPPPSRISADDARFRVAEDLERPESVREGLASGRVRALNGETASALLTREGSGPPSQPGEPPPLPSPALPSSQGSPRVAEISPKELEKEQRLGRTDEEVALSTKVPQYVVKQLRLRYAETGVTIRNQILLALRDAGLTIDDRDITDERKRPRS